MPSADKIDRLVQVAALECLEDVEILQVKDHSCLRVHQYLFLRKPQPGYPFGVVSSPPGKF